MSNTTINFHNVKTIHIEQATFDVTATEPFDVTKITIIDRNDEQLTINLFSSANQIDNNIVGEYTNVGE